MNNNLSIKKLQKLIESKDIIEISNLQIENFKNNNRDEFDCIYFGTLDFEKYKNDIFVIVNRDSNKYAIAYPKHNDKISDNKYALNYVINSNIENNNNNLTIYKLCNENKISLKHIKTQTFKDIKDESITISENYRYLFNTDCNYYILRNNTSNCKLVISKYHLVFSDKLADNSIKLNRKQRIILNAIDIKDKDNKDIEYDFTLYPYPNILVDSLNLFKNITIGLLKLYVGKVNIGLIAKRTYQSDETFNIVRMSSDIMKILGIKDTDYVKISYLDTSCHSRVLAINDKEKLTKQNSELNSIPIFEFENMIFIPASIRSELGIPSVLSNVAVKVERDMGYIFKKNINQQILPIILILFSTEIFVNGRELLVKIIIALISLPITMYFNLSNERAICK